LRLAIRTVPASGATAGATLEMIGRGEDHVPSFEVVVLGVKMVALGAKRAGLGGGLVGDVWIVAAAHDSFSLDLHPRAQKRGREQ